MWRKKVILEQQLRCPSPALPEAPGSLRFNSVRAAKWTENNCADNKAQQNLSKRHTCARSRTCTVSQAALRWQLMEVKAMATTKRVSILANESCQDAVSFERTQQQAGAHAATLTGTYWRRVFCGDTLAGVKLKHLRNCKGQQEQRERGIALLTSDTRLWATV